MVRPERFELPASWFVARRSIQLSYGRISRIRHAVWPHPGPCLVEGANSSTTRRSSRRTVAEREGFEPSMGF